MISFSCPSCGARMRVPPEAAGRPSRCPTCKAVTNAPTFQVIETKASPPPSTALAVREKNDAGLMRFNCPCGKRLKAPLGTAGQLATCPKCGQKVAVPQAGAVEQPGADADLDDGSEELVKYPDRSEDSGIDPLLFRRQILRERRRTRRLVVTAAAFLAVVGAVVAVVVTRKRPNAPTPPPPATEVVRASDPHQQPPPPVRDPAVVRPTPETAARPIEGWPTEPPESLPPPEPKTTDLRQPRPPADGFTKPPAEPTPRPPFKSDRPAKEMFRGYFQRTVGGFRMYVSRLAYEKSDEAEGEPLKVVDDEIQRISEIFNDKALKALRTVPVWVEWDHTIPQLPRAFAVYYGRTGDAALFEEGVDPRKSGCICVLSLKVAHELKNEKGARKNTLLHEFAHAVHDKVWGFDNTFIANAYRRAQARGLYEKVRHDNGYTGEAYAARNRNEYFAELSCAYLDRLDYIPHEAQELKEYDSVGYEIMTKAWGTPEEIERARKGRKKP